MIDEAIKRANNLAIAITDGDSDPAKTFEGLSIQTGVPVAEIEKLFDRLVASMMMYLGRGMPLEYMIGGALASTFAIGWFTRDEQLKESE